MGDFQEHLIGSASIGLALSALWLVYAISNPVISGLTAWLLSPVIVLFVATGGVLPDLDMNGSVPHQVSMRSIAVFLILLPLVMLINWNLERAVVEPLRNIMGLGMSETWLVLSLGYLISCVATYMSFRKFVDRITGSHRSITHSVLMVIVALPYPGILYRSVLPLLGKYEAQLFFLVPFFSSIIGFGIHFFLDGILTPRKVRELLEF